MFIIENEDEKYGTSWLGPVPWANWWTRNKTEAMRFKTRHMALKEARKRGINSRLNVNIVQA